MRKLLPYDTDFYKLGHAMSMNPEVDSVTSYMEPRVGAKYAELCFFGSTAKVQDSFLQQVTEDMIHECERRAKASSGFDMFQSEVWRKVAKLGYLPMRIMAVPEGTVVPNGNVLMKFKETEPWFAKSVNGLESNLMHVRATTDICTRAFNIKRAILPYFKKSSDITDLVMPVAVNDFGYRGGKWHEASAFCGAGFLVHFNGSDNLPAETVLMDYYNLEDGYLQSVWATEHCDALSFGRNNELDYVKHQLTKSNPKQIVSIVMDAYDQDNFAKEIACHPEIVELIKARTGRVVFRPDTDIPLNNMLKYSEILSATYGLSYNGKEYKVIGSNVGLLQGDGMNEHTIPELYRDYTNNHWAADNIITGSGGGLLEVNADRDLNRWAIKPCQMSKNGVVENVAKTPKSDMSKASKCGDVKLHRMGGDAFITMESSKNTPQEFNAYTDCLEVIYENGNYKKEHFSNIVNRAKSYL